MRVRLLPLLLLFAIDAHAQIASINPAQPYVAELTLGDATLRGGGRWRSADLALTRTRTRGVDDLFVDSVSRPEGHGTFAAVAATHDWTNRLFTYAAAGASLNRSTFLPTARVDAEVDAKLLRNRQLVASIGATAARYVESRRDELLSAGLTYYAPVIVSYRHYFNRSFPGSVPSRADMIQGAIERPGRTSAFLRYSWGNEAYLLTNIVNPFAVSVSGHTATLMVRQWLAPRGGLTGGIEQQSKGADFRRFGVRFGGFYAF